MKKTRIFLTGATGVMGSAGLKELSAYPDNYDITVLARETGRNKRKLKPFISNGVKVVWGDLLDEIALRRGIRDADIVLHVGGMVSPLADLYPEKTLEVNIGSMKLIGKLVKEYEDKERGREIKVVNIGSVSQYGSKLPPHHWGKVGDPMQAAKLDNYAVSKIMAERILLESGVKKWVSIRQTAILHPGLLKNATNPVAFHTPINGVLEWITTEDSGRLLERVCREDVPDDFWCNFYNAGGGEPFRLTNLEFEKGVIQATIGRNPEEIFDTNWFAADNFHGMWFSDSDNLDKMLHFREKDSFEETLLRLKKTMPVFYRLAPIAPAPIIKLFLKRVASKPELGPLWWIKTNDEKRIRLSWGSKENYDKIPGWSELNTLELQRKSPEKSEDNLKSPDNELHKVLCDKGHEYLTSEALEKGGHGCPHCLFVDSEVEEFM